MESLVMTEEFSMDELLGQSEAIKAGAVVEGVVVGQVDSNFIVNVGLKQEALLSSKEFGVNPPAIGDKISVLLIRIGGPEGHPMVSWKQARERVHWDRLLQLKEKNEIVEGKITQRVKGGVLVDIGLDAFMPASQIDERPVGKPEEWVGKSVKVLVLEMDRAKGNVLVSRRRVQEQEKAVRRGQTLEKLEVGQVHKGRVTGLTNFGAFVDIGGIEGLLHISDLAWGRVDSPKGHVKIGDELDVKVLKYDTTTHRISLGRKQLLPHPWEGIETRFPKGSKISGKITGMAAFGVFVEIEPGIEGLVHISEISWTEEVKNPKDLYKVGQGVEAVVIDIDRAKEKISLSVKRAESNPWEGVSKAYPVGSRVEGEVTHLTNFGAFIKVAPGIEALLKSGDLSWTDKIQSPSKLLKVGDKIKAVVLDINLKEEKMSLGLKQLIQDPMKSLRAGQVITGTVAKVTDFGVFVKMESGIDGLVRHNEVQNKKSMFDEEKGRPSAPEQPVYKEGDVVQAVVTKINKKERKIELSIRRFEHQLEKELLKKYSGNTGNTTLGDATGWTDAFDKEDQ